MKNYKLHVEILFLILFLLLMYYCFHFNLDDNNKLAMSQWFCQCCTHFFRYDICILL